MHFLRGDQSGASQAIAKRLGDELLAGKRVLWLTSGGSNVALQVSVMDLVRTRCGDRLEGLAIMPMDERYGPPGHKDSNTQALRTAGFSPGTAMWVDVLMHDMPFDQTIGFYNEVAQTAFANAAVMVGQFGLGPDGHIAGILPGSPATEVDAATVVGYEWTDYTRLTLTAGALRQISAAYVPAFGANKEKALRRLQKKKEPFKKLPARLLYEIDEAYVYNDFITDEE